MIEGTYKPYVQIFNSKIAINNGYISFTANDPSAPNGKKVIPARFTFLYRKADNGEWEVISHHNSVMPSAPAGLKPGYAFIGPEAKSGGFFSKLFGK